MPRMTAAIAIRSHFILRILPEPCARNKAISTFQDGAYTCRQRVYSGHQGEIRGRFERVTQSRLVVNQVKGFRPIRPLDQVAVRANDSLLRLAPLDHCRWINGTDR